MTSTSTTTGKRTAAGHQAHCAKFSQPIIDAIRAYALGEAELLDRRPIIVDPFAGSGRIHDLGDFADTYGFEIEEEYAALHHRTVVADSRHLAVMWAMAHGVDAKVDIVATSPVYPNGMTDVFKARDNSERNTYQADLGRPPSEGSAVLAVRGARKLTPAYRELHEMVWAQCLQVLAPGGLILCNTSNHFVGSVLQRVTEWHLNVWLRLGCSIHEVKPIWTKRNGNGANGKVRDEAERLMILRAPR